MGRTKEDNRQILSLIEPHKDIQIRMTDMPSPIVLIPSGATEEIVREAATLCAAYSKAQHGLPARVSVTSPAGLKMLTVRGDTREAYRQCLI